MRFVRPIGSARRAKIAAVVALVSLARAPLAQSWWQSPTGPASACGSLAMAYDSRRGVSVLFGSSGSPCNETWEFDGRSWSQRAPAIAPPWRVGHAMAYDSRRGVTVLFGGRTGSGFRNDTWEWDGSSWSLRLTLIAPPPRTLANMVYDSARGVVVLFGGDQYGFGIDDTWEWDGTTWRLRLPLSQPPPRVWSQAMAFDVRRGVSVLFAADATPTQTWEWDGTSWTMRNPAAAPPTVPYASAYYDAARGVTVLIEASTALDVWEWTGDKWNRKSLGVGPPNRSVFATAYDARLGAGVLYGGGSNHRLQDTWLYGGPVFIPVAASGKEGDASLAQPFTATGRIQTLIDPVAVTNTAPGLVVGLDYRRDQGNSNFLARTVSVVVEMGLAGTTAASMSATFASNWRVPPMAAFSGSLALPALAAVPSGPAGFDIHLPFGVPFAWNGTDRLLVELQVTSNNGIGPYDLDAFSLPQPSGGSFVFAYGCAAASGTAPHFAPVNPVGLAPGGSLTANLDRATAGALGVLLLGDSIRTWGGVTLPFTWPGTNCTLYTNALATASRPVSAAGTAQVVWAVPMVPILQGYGGFLQWAVVEPMGSFPPITTTDAQWFWLGLLPSYPFQTIVSPTGGAVGTPAVLGALVPAMHWQVN